MRVFSKAQVIKVVDGDTVDLKIDLGFYVHAIIRIRLHGVDTPERGSPLFEQATEVHRELLNDVADENRQFLVRVYKTGKFGRWLGWIDGVNDVLAETWPYRK